MLATTLIVKKREGRELGKDEIRFLVDGFCDGTVADYQMSALAMAICLKGMTQQETADLTDAMLQSGDRLPRGKSIDRLESSQANRANKPRVDKHSTGGLGDKISLILAPLLAVCDVDVPMISGRGLGLSGGTLDKLESIPGFRTDLDLAQSSQQLGKLGTFIVSASENIAPADRRLYALRDVTGTVESVPLITASILSKKLAASLDALVMDVKVGSAAFMKNLDDARSLATSIVQVAAQSGLPTTALITDMDQPLGCSVGNAIEVNESMDVLKGGGPDEVRELTIELCANLLVQAGQGDRKNVVHRLREKLDSGEAWQRFDDMVRAQGGTLNGPLTTAEPTCIESSSQGYVSEIDCQAIGEAVVAMGGGRRKMGDSIDPAVGVDVHVRVGDQVEKGQKVVTVFCDRYDSYSGLTTADRWIKITPHSCPARPLIIQRIES